jgi:hypothetical protein
MSGPGWLRECWIAQKTLYLTAVATFKLVDIEWCLKLGCQAGSTSGRVGR